MTSGTTSSNYASGDHTHEYDDITLTNIITTIDYNDYTTQGFYKIWSVYQSESTNKPTTDGGLLVVNQIPYGISQFFIPYTSQNGTAPKHLYYRTHYGSGGNNIWSNWEYLVGGQDIVDNLTSTDTTKVLSAKQGGELKALLDNKEDSSNKVSSWSSTTTDTHYPSEKLVKDSLDGKADSTHTHDNYLTSSDISGKIDTAGTGLSKSGTTLNHSNSITALTTASLKKVKYDAQGHITGTSDVTSSDLPSHTHNYASTSHAHGNITSDGKIGGATGKIVVTTGNGVLDVADSITKSKISDFAHTHEYLSSSDLGLSSFTTEDFYETTNWDVEPNIIRTDELIFNDDSIHNFTFNDLTYPFTITFDVIEAGGSIKRGNTELNSSRTPTQIIIVGNSSYSYTITNVETGDYWNSSSLGLKIQNDADDVVRIRNFKFTNDLLKPQIDNKIELSDLQSLLQTWESYTLNTYATLYVNHTLRQCELYYARSFSSGSANNLYNWGTGLIPSEYRPSHQVTGVIDQLGTCYVDADGNFKGRFTNAITSSTACKMTVQWHY